MQALQTHVRERARRAAASGNRTEELLLQASLAFLQGAQQRLGRRVQQLLEDDHDKRDRAILFAQRQVIFPAHVFGGLVVEGALFGGELEAHGASVALGKAADLDLAAAQQHLRNLVAQVVELAVLGLLVLAGMHVLLQERVVRPQQMRIDQAD